MMNTPRVVMQDTKKAFRAIDKRKDIEAAVAALSNLKGVGPAMASGNHHLAKLTNVAREENVLTTATTNIISTQFGHYKGTLYFFLCLSTDCISVMVTGVSLQRGRFYPQLTNLVRINTPRAVQTESRKAFRKLPNLEAAITTLCGLKGVGTTLASGPMSSLG